MKHFIIHSEDGNFRTLVKALLDSPNINIVEAGSRRELVRRCSREHFDKVITDDTRAFMNGSDILKQIRSNNRRIEIFILSADNSEHSVLSLLEMGITQFLSIPICVERLQNKLLK